MTGRAHGERETRVSVETEDRADEAADRRREQRGWYFYDFACSVYSTSVLTVFLGPYLTSVAKAAADADGYVHPLGVPVRAGSVFAYAVSVSVVVAVLVMPLAGAVADRTGRKKPLLAAAAYVGATATTCMFFLDGDRYLLGALLLIVANAAVSVSMVLYNAYLPQIAGPRSATTSPRAAGPSATPRARWSSSSIWCSTRAMSRSVSPSPRRYGSVWPRPGSGGAPSRSSRCAGCATAALRRAARGRWAPAGGSW